MGTRHLQTVITKEGEKKVQQYGQWDGYPSGQGVQILDFLRTADLEKYQQNLVKIHQATEAELDMVNADDKWQEKYPHMSRDCGSDIHKLIEQGKVDFVFMSDEDERWCEGFYTIDFEQNTFQAEYHGREKIYKLDALPSDKQFCKDLNDPLS